MQITLYISIHAPTRGATRKVYADGCQAVISIHAPTRGATCLYGFGYMVIFISIHAPTRGATVDHDTMVETILIFQSTLLQEERLLLHKISKHIFYFNPRSYKRSDSRSSGVLSTIFISIHAPTRGATFKRIRKI